MLTRTVRTGLTAAVAALSAACSPLSLFNTFTPKDPARAVLKGEAYGADPRQKLDVYAPPRTPGRPAPIAVFFYGGSWDSGHREDYSWVGKAMASRGYVTVVADYRVYPQVRFPAFLADGAQAVRWSVDHAQALGGDPDRIVLIGHSAGAYNAVMLGLDTRYLKAAGVAPTRIKALVGLSGPYDFLPLDGPVTRKTFGQAADLAATQPVNAVRADAPPAFLATGDADTVVYPKNTRKLAAALRAKGVDVTEKVYLGLDHARMVLALSKPFRGKAPVLSDLTAFLNTHMR